MHSRKLRGLARVASYQHDSLGYLRSLRELGEVAYRLTLPPQLSGVYHVSIVPYCGKDLIGTSSKSMKRDLTKSDRLKY